MQAYTLRIHCALCKGDTLTPFYRTPSFPISLSTASSSTDLYAPLTFASCATCECVQLLELIDPEILYGNAHNNTAETPTWKEHHQQFAHFIEEKTTLPILEVGGADGTLASHLLQHHPNRPYTCLDLCPPKKPIEGVRHCIGNCETYTYDASQCVIASHVFEHLYNPSDFVKRLADSSVGAVAISIPTMRSWLDTHVLSFLHREHTFYIDADYLTNLFQRHGYTLRQHTPFRVHSEFFFFVRDGGALSTPIYRLGELRSKFEQYLYAREMRLSVIDLSGPTYIFPAGHYGQLVYTALKGCGKADLILGFLDNDPSKIGNRMYGTPCSVYSPAAVQNNTSCTILLVASVYAAEIKQQLLSICKTLTIIEL